MNQSIKSSSHDGDGSPFNMANDPFDDIIEIPEGAALNSDRNMFGTKSVQNKSMSNIGSSQGQQDFNKLQKLGKGEIKNIL